MDLYSSTSKAGVGLRARLEEQKRKKLERHGKGSGGGGGGVGGDSSLLAQIQDDLQSSRDRYFAKLDDATGPTANRSVVCEEDPETSPALTGNVVNTALIDSQVYTIRERLHR